jgi:hypothetical protein
MYDGKYIPSTIICMTIKKKLGRPKLPKSEARSIMLSTRVNADENKAIKKAIAVSGEDKTAWLRGALLNAAQMPTRLQT